MRNVAYFDFERVKDLMERFGWSQKKLAIRSGVSEPIISRVTNGEYKNMDAVGFGNVISIANAFDLSIHAFLRTPNPHWERLDIEDPECHHSFMTDLFRGPPAISVNKSLDSYLLPDVIAVENKLLQLKGQALGSEKHAHLLRVFEEYLPHRRSARRTGKYSHQIIGSPAFLVAGLRKNPELYDGVRQSILAHRDRSAPCFIPRDKWLGFYRALDAELPFHGWTKINIAAGVRAVVWHNEEISYTDHKATVDRLWARIQNSARPYMPDARQGDYDGEDSGLIEAAARRSLVYLDQALMAG